MLSGDTYKERKKPKAKFIRCSIVIMRDGKRGEGGDG